MATHQLKYYSTPGKIRYLDRLELYKSEKSYEVTFLPINVTQPGARRSNLSFSSYSIQFKDLSQYKKDFSTDIQGFELDQFPTTLSLEELKDLENVKSQYHAEARSYLKRMHALLLGRASLRSLVSLLPKLQLVLNLLLPGLISGILAGVVLGGIHNTGTYRLCWAKFVMFYIGMADDD